MFFFKYFIYLFLDKGEGREKERKRNLNVAASHTPPTGDLAHSPGMCPDWESNQRPFGLLARSQFKYVLRVDSEGFST